MSASLRLPVWLLAFISPSLYCVSLLLANRFGFAPALPPAFYLTLFVLIIVGALFWCAGVPWVTAMTLPRKIGVTAFASLGLLAQLGLIVLVLRAILIAITAYPQ